MIGVHACAWPGCLSRFPTGQGPIAIGWRAFISPAILLCPFHADLGHNPMVSRTKHGMRFRCTCEDWQGDLVASLEVGLHGWKDHVRVQLEQTG